MDGLTITTQQGLLETGRTKSEHTRRRLAPDVPQEGKASFAQSLNKAIGEVNEAQKVADRKMEELATGRTDNIAEVMIAAEKADISLRLMTQIRNKILDAYQEIMRMQV